MNSIHALLFGLSDDLAGELAKPLAKLCSKIQWIGGDRSYENLSNVAGSSAQIIFCGADTQIVTKLRESKPEAPIVVVSRLPEVSDWLDSIEAGAADYCAAPFEHAQLRWILETSMRAATVSA